MMFSVFLANLPEILAFILVAEWVFRLTRWIFRWHYRNHRS